MGANCPYMFHTSRTFLAEESQPRARVSSLTLFTYSCCRHGAGETTHSRRSKSSGCFPLSRADQHLPAFPVQLKLATHVRLVLRLLWRVMVGFCIFLAIRGRGFGSRAMWCMLICVFFSAPSPGGSVASHTSCLSTGSRETTSRFQWQVEGDIAARCADEILEVDCSKETQTTSRASCAVCMFCWKCCLV